MTWDEAEKRFPGCSAQWDIDGGPAWVARLADAFGPNLWMEIRTLPDIIANQDKLYVDIIDMSEGQMVIDYMVWEPCQSRWLIEDACGNTSESEA